MCGQSPDSFPVAAQGLSRCHPIARAMNEQWVPGGGQVSLLPSPNQVPVQKQVWVCPPPAETACKASGEHNPSRKGVPEPDGPAGPMAQAGEKRPCPSSALQRWIPQEPSLLTGTPLISDCPGL